MDRGVWWAISHGVTKSQTQLSMHDNNHTCNNNTKDRKRSMLKGSCTQTVLGNSKSICFTCILDKDTC